MKVISRSEVIKRVQEIEGRIFGVTFVKRTTGELRTMACRLGVRSRLHGGVLKYNPTEKNLLIVFDVNIPDELNRGAYRSIPIENIKSLTIEGETYIVE